MTTGDLNAPIARVIEALARVGCPPRRTGRSWRARCPAHADRTPSLSLSEGDAGRVLIHCFGGCDFHGVLQALGLSVEDLFRSLDRPSRVETMPFGVTTQSSRRAGRRPPADDVRVLWARCRPMHEDHEAVAWAEGRGFDPFLIADRDLCRALPAEADVPPWAYLRGAPWTLGGYRILAPLYDALGRPASLHARNVNRAVSPKGALPCGFAASGLVLADGAALQVLRGSQLHGALWIAEGVPDFLSCGCGWSDAAGDTAPAVLGVLAGSWTAAVAARIPTGARVVIAVHHDQAGEKYCATIARSLMGRCSLERWIPGEVAL